MARFLLLTLVVAALGAVSLLPPGGGDRARAAFPGGNGKIAFVSDRDGNSEIYVMNPDGRGQTNLTNNPADDREPAWSADGSQLAFSSDRDGDFEVYVMDRDGTDVRQVTDDPAQDGMPSWAPGGDRLAFVSDRDGTMEIHVMDADGSNVRQLTFKEANGFNLYPSWSPSGATIAYTPYSATISTMTPDGLFVAFIASGFEHDWAPDIRHIVYAAQYGPMGRSILIADVPRPAYFVPNPLTDWSGGGGYDSEPAWSPDGGKIVFSRHVNDQDAEIAVMTSDGNDLEMVTDNNAEDSDPAWQPIVAGDANCQGGIDAIDAALVLQFGAGLFDALPCPGRADVNGDGVVNPVDAALILQYAAGLLDSLPP